MAVYVFLWGYARPPKTKLPNVILFHCITTNMRGKKGIFFPMGLNFQFIYFLCVPFCTCPQKIHSHIHTPQKEQSTFSQVPFFSQNLIFIYSVIHPLSTSFYQGGKEANPGQFVRLSQDQCRQGKHAKTWVIIETGTVVFWGDVLTVPQVPSFQYNLLCIIGLNVV